MFYSYRDPRSDAYASARYWAKIINSHAPYTANHNWLIPGLIHCNHQLRGWQYIHFSKSYPAMVEYTRPRVTIDRNPSRYMVADYIHTPAVWVSSSILLTPLDLSCAIEKELVLCACEKVEVSSSILKPLVPLSTPEVGVRGPLIGPFLCFLRAT